MSVSIIGQRIRAIRTMTADEYNKMCWSPTAFKDVVVIELNNGTKIFPSSDYEGNDGGALMGFSRDQVFTVMP